MLAASGFVLPAQDVTFQATAEFVTVDVEVLQDGRPVTGLRRADFRVWDNGVEQTVSHFGADDRELDVLLLVDTSSSTQRIRQAIQLSAAQALGKLHLRDRAGVITFAADSEIESTLTCDRAQLLDAIQALPEPKGGTEFNRNILLTAMYLRQNARPGVRRAMVIFTDNLGSRVMPNHRVREELWEADAILSGLLFQGRDQAGAGDVQPFVKATGGDLLKYDGSTDQLALVFERLRSRYTLLYAKPLTKPGEARRIKVSLTEEARRRLGGRWEIRARTGYVADRPGLDGREKLKTSNGSDGRPVQ